MRHLLTLLYPKAWRDRYGAELEALLEDAPMNWLRIADLLKGALGMQLRYRSAWGIVLGLATAGTLAGILASFCITPEWRAVAVVQIAPGQISQPPSSADATRTTEAVQRLVANATSRTSLFGLITDKRLDLYPGERATDPIEDIEDTMRAAIHITIMPPQPRKIARIFTVAFLYPDRKKAEATLNTLINRFMLEAVETRADYFLDTLDPPYTSQKPYYPNRVAFAAAGAVSGLILSLVVLLIRRRTTPGFQPA